MQGLKNTLQKGTIQNMEDKKSEYDIKIVLGKESGDAETVFTPFCHDDGNVQLWTGLEEGYFGKSSFQGSINDKQSPYHPW